jgi:UDP-N-acetyl-D-mannosaminuronate dehydrogenase
MSGLAATLLDRIQTRRARAGGAGVGYGGLPLAVELAKAGFHTTGSISTIARFKRSQEASRISRTSPAPTSAR